MPRPEIHLHEAARDRICAECKHFAFQRREPVDKAQGWAFCLKSGKWFGRQGAIIDLEKNTLTFDSPGKRTCESWE